MVEIGRYFEYKNDIHRSLFILNEKDSVPSFILSCTNLINCKVVYVVSKYIETLDFIRESIHEAQESGSLPIDISFNYIQSQSEKEMLDIRNIDLVFFDLKTSLQEILQCIDLDPVYVVGRIWRDSIPSFRVWEAFRNNASHIYIDCVYSNKSEIVDWTKPDDNDIELSVVFPVYNVASYLRQCLESVTAWKAPYIEFLFINDGSPDNSRDIISEYCKKDARVKLIDKENGGCASARERGIQEARGRYIGLVDPDDFIDPTMFKKLFKRALRGNYDVSYCGYNEYYESSQRSRRIPDALGEPYISGTINKIDIENLMVYQRVAIWRAIYKAEFLKQNDIHFQTNLRRFDDLPFKDEVYACAKSVVCVPEYLYYYRLQRPGQDVSCDDDRLYVHFPIFEYLNQRLGAFKNQRILDLLQVSKIQTHCFAVHKIQSKYMKEYCSKARKDLQTNGMTIGRSLYLLKKYCGGTNSKAYLGIMIGKYSWIK